MSSKDEIKRRLGSDLLVGKDEATKTKWDDLTPPISPNPIKPVPQPKNATRYVAGQTLPELEDIKESIKGLDWDNGVGSPTKPQRST